MTTRQASGFVKPLDEITKSMKNSQLPTRKRSVSGPCHPLPEPKDYSGSRRKSMIPVPPSHTNNTRRAPFTNNNNNDIGSRGPVSTNSIPALHESSKRKASTDQVDTNDYAAMLDIQTFQDLTIEKKQLTELMRSINYTDSQIKTLEQEKRQIRRDIRKFKGMIEDCKVNYENLDKTLIIKARAIDNEIQQHEKLRDQSKENVTGNFLKTLNEKEKEFKSLLTSSLEDFEAENNHKKELEKIEVEIEATSSNILKIKRGNELALKQLQNELDEDVTKINEELEAELSVLENQLSSKEKVLSSLTRELEELNFEKSQRFTKLNILRDKINGSSEFQGSLDKVISDMKLKRLKLLSELDRKNKEIMDFEVGEFSSSKATFNEITNKYQVEKHQRLKIQYQLFEFQNKPRLAVLEYDQEFDSSQFPEVEFYTESDELLDATSVYVEDVLAGVSCCIIEIGKEEIQLKNIVLKLQMTLGNERFKRFHYDISSNDKRETILEGLNCSTITITRTNVKSNSQCKTTLSLVSLVKLEHLQELMIRYCGKFRCFTIVNGIEGNDKLELLQQMKKIPFVSKSQASLL